MGGDLGHLGTFRELGAIRRLARLVLLCLCAGWMLFPDVVTAASPSGQVLPGDARVTTVPFKLIHNKILVPVRINGSAIYDFVLDTGSPVMLLAAPELADSMQLERGRRLTMHGAGRGEAPEAWRSTGATLSIVTTGDIIELTGEPIFVLAENPSFGAYLGVRSYGIVGRALFDRFVVEIDFELNRLVLHDPERYVYQGLGEVIALRLVGGHPHCEGTLVLPNGDRRRLDLVIDSGAGSALTVIEDGSGGLPAPASAVPRRLGRGLNGEIQGVVTRLPRLELGSMILNDIVTSFARRQSGIAPRAQANLGADVLRRFRVVFDYRHRRMILEPGAGIDEPFDIDMSGLLLRAEGIELDQLIIEQVREGSPAALVGIEAGDELVAMDGQQVTLEQAVRLLRTRDGYVLPLTLDRDGRKLEKQLTLKQDI